MPYFSIKIWKRGFLKRFKLFEKERLNQTRVDPYMPNIKMSRRGRAMSLPTTYVKTS
jgi:hypothetical protein